MNRRSNKKTVVRARLKSMSQFILENKDQFGDEISKINTFLKKEHEDHDDFEWDGDTLNVMFGDEKESISYTREELASKIDGFPASASVDESILVTEEIAAEDGVEIGGGDESTIIPDDENVEEIHGDQNLEDTTETQPIEESRNKKR